MEFFFDGLLQDIDDVAVKRVQEKRHREDEDDIFAVSAPIEIGRHRGRCRRADGDVFRRCRHAVPPASPSSV